VTKTIAVVLAAGLLSACAYVSGAGSASPTPDGFAADPMGSWVLTAATGPGGAIRLFDDHRVTLTVQGDEIGGTSACNQYFGQISFAGNAVRITNIGGTEMACEPDVMETESAYAAALLAVTRWGRDGDVLRLAGEGVDLRFTLLPPVQDEEIVGTTWVLDSLIQGDAVSSVLGEATLVLAADGTFSGSTGCRQLSGTYVINGDEIEFAELAANGNCPAELQRQDALVIDVLEGGFSTSVNGPSLTLTDNAGQGLGYRAAPGIE
jgi:heat shock protein HslJ